MAKVAALYVWDGSAWRLALPIWRNEGVIQWPNVHYSADGATWS